MLEYVESVDDLARIKIEATIPHTTRFKECADQNMPIQMLKTNKSSDEGSREKAEKSIRKVIQELQERGII